MKETWRTSLLVAVLVATWSAYAWMFTVADLAVRRRLGLLTAVLVIATAATLWTRRSQLGANRLTAAVALGSIVNVACAALVVGAEQLWSLGLIPALATNWLQFAMAILGVVGAAFTWTMARGKPSVPPETPTLESGSVEPAPPVAAALDASPDWEGIAEQLASDPVRRVQLAALRRIDATLHTPDQAQRIVRQEVKRLLAASEAEHKESDDNDVLSQAASLLEWGAQKLPELAELDVSDVLMGKAIADIRARHSSVEHVFVDHRELLAIHPIDRATADEKCNERAEAARRALPVLEANGHRLSEALVASDPDLEMFRSVTGFQVVQVPGGYVTFEGNGRREALQRAFGEKIGIEVEVRLYRFEDSAMRETIARRVERVRRWKGVA